MQETVITVDIPFEVTQWMQQVHVQSQVNVVIISMSGIEPDYIKVSKRIRLDKDQNLRDETVDCIDDESVPCS